MDRIIEQQQAGEKWCWGHYEDESLSAERPNKKPVPVVRATASIHLVCLLTIRRDVVHYSIMAYNDFAEAVEALRRPISRISALYEEVRVGIEGAVQVNDVGAVTINRSALREGIVGILPPGSDGTVEIQTLTQGLEEMGCAMSNGQIIAPWSALLNNEIVSIFDQETWRTFGLVSEGIRGRTRPFGRFPNVPAAVRAPENMSILREVASAAISIQNMNLSPMMQTMSASPMLLAPENIARVIRRRRPAEPADPGDIGTTTQALNVDDFRGIVGCLQSARYSWSGPFIVNICMSKACADTLVGLLSLGVGTLLSAGVALVLQGITAALAAVGGWIALGIILSAAAWALMIHLNATPRGVCIHIPMPWTFGLIGPGWASGIPA